MSRESARGFHGEHSHQPLVLVNATVLCIYYYSLPYVRLNDSTLIAKDFDRECVGLKGC